jgi:hypothetical protein
MAGKYIALLVAVGIVGGLLVWLLRPDSREQSPRPGASSVSSSVPTVDPSGESATGPGLGPESNDVEAVSRALAPRREVSALPDPPGAGAQVDDLAVPQVCTVTGRIVDDLGNPVQGAEVFVVPNRFFRKMPRTIPESPWSEPGAFAIDVGRLERPGGQGPRGRRRADLEPIRVRVRSGTRYGTAGYASFEPGGTVDAGQLVLPRACSFVGIVLDFEGRPVPDALVSMRPRRVGAFYEEPFTDRPPSRVQPVFDLEGRLLGPDGANETATDSAGRFTVEPFVTETRALVVSGGCQQQVFALPGLVPGEIATDVTLRLGPATIFRLRPVDSAGNAIPRDAFLETVQVGRQQRVTDEILASVRLVAGDTAPLLLSPGKDSTLRCQLEGPGEEAIGLDFAVPGYQPSSLELSNGIRQGETVPIVLQGVETHALNLRLHFTPARTPDGENLVSSIGVVVELEPSDAVDLPVYEGNRPIELLKNAHRRKVITPLRGNAPDLEMRLSLGSAHARRVKVSAATVATGYGIGPPLDYGPFSPGEAVHDIHLGSLEDLVVPLEAQEPGDPIGVVRFRVVEALTGRPIFRVLCGADPLTPGMSEGKPRWVEVAGGWRQVELTFGRWELKVKARGFVEVTRQVDVRAGASIDLGTLGLEPEEVLHIQWCESDGRPVAEGTSGSLEWEGSSESLLTDADGWSEITGTLPVRLEGWVHLKLRGEGGIGEQVTLQRHAGRRATGVLEARRSVRFLVSGFDPGRDGRVEQFSLESLDVPAVAAPARVGVTGDVLEFKGRLVPGAHELVFESELYELTDTIVQIPPGEGEHVVRLRARRK